MEDGTNTSLTDEQSLEELYEHAPCGYLSAAAHDNRIVRVNATLLDWTGHSREQLLGQRRFVDLLPAGGRIYYETHVAPLLHVQGTVREVAFDLVCADGTRLPVLVHAALVRGTRAPGALIRLTLFNAVERRRYERELLAERRRADEAALAKARFISVLSHEIRNPLTVISNLASVLARSSTNPGQQRAIAVLNESSRELAELVTNVLDLNRIEAGKQPLQEHPFEMRDWLQKIVQQASARAEAKGLAFVVALEPSIPQHLVGDHVKIRQVLTNLIGNAVKFTHRGRVTLRVELLSLFGDMARVRFVVADTGVGIAAERIVQLFDDFTQGSYEIGANYGGTGLGLAICKRLLALYGSQIEVSSQPGQGSEFRFDLTLRVARAPAAESGDAAARLRGLSVLVVDDNHIDSLAVSALLASWGLSVNAAADVAQAVDLMRWHHYDAILMERTMPGLGGESAARVLRRSAHPPGGSPRIIALSSTSDRALDAGELNAAGFDDVVRKPVASEALLQALGLRCHPTP